MRLIAPALCLALAGCAMTPAEVIERGPHTVHELTLPPERAAGCIARNVEAVSNALRVEVRPGTMAGSQELVLRVAGDTVMGAAGVVDLRPASTGSRATVYRHPSAADAAVFERMLPGC